MAAPTRRPGHRHGNARQALVAAAEALLESTGAAGLSLRQLSEHAGLSRQAAYNHFADKQALLAELARAGFEKLEKKVRRAAARHAGEMALAAAGEAYIAFAQNAPAQFRLMFSRELVDISHYPDAGAAGNAAFQALVEVVATLTAKERVEALSLAAWCQVHGYATLCLEASLEPKRRRRERARLFARLIAGEAARQPR
ncbi:TetR family transcriptional regulator [Alcanivorax sp. N3-2A]|nr:TetR family transcriptional regulator [Alcanivorax sp. N3-2A]|tara:strand:+ start:129054 stop:129650 length:597 start_codon:yes stop_codon:yes gene_type:complete